MFIKTPALLYISLITQAQTNSYGHTEHFISEQASMGYDE